MTPRGALWSVFLLLLSAGAVRAAEPLPVLARVGPWPILDKPIAYQGRLWFANSVARRNHNSADIYSYDPAAGTVRYERHLFSQDAGHPAIARGLLYWPFEDPRFSVGWGHYMVTDGQAWRTRAIPAGRAFHAHGMAVVGRRLVAATSAWRARLSVSDDGGVSWRQVYDHPTEDRRVSRITSLHVVGDRVFGFLVDRRAAGTVRKLLQLDGDRVSAVPDWPDGRPVYGLAAHGDGLFALVDEGAGVAVWRTDGTHSARVAAPRDGWRPRTLASVNGALWAATSDPGADAGTLWHSADGAAWDRRSRLEGGVPTAIAGLGGGIYVTGAGDDGTGILWGTGSGASSTAAADATLPAPAARSRDWSALADRLDALLANPESYDGYGREIRDLLHDAALAGAPAGFFADRLKVVMPRRQLDLIGGDTRIDAAGLGRWLVLWAMARAGQVGVPVDWIAAPWTAPPNASEKYFFTPPIAIWAAGEAGQGDTATVGALVERLDFTDDPLWLRGDVVGALTAITGQRFGYDVPAWRRWWRAARSG